MTKLEWVVDQTTPINTAIVEKLGQGFIDYAKTLTNADKIRLAAELLGYADAVQQTATITRDDLWHAKETTTLFDDVEEDDPMEPSYHLFNLLGNLASDFDELADVMDGEYN